jgi:hypothetical protein
MDHGHREVGRLEYTVKKEGQERGNRWTSTDKDPDARSNQDKGNECIQRREKEVGSV